MGQLFWKIFLSFWLTLVLVLLASNWGTALYWQASKEVQSTINRDRVAQMQIQTVADALEFDGIATVRRILKRNHRLRSPFYIHINIEDEQGNIVLGKPRSRPKPRSKPPHHDDAEKRPIKNISKIINAVDGKNYRIVGVYPHKMRPPSLFRPLLRPFKNSPGLLILWLGIAVFTSAIVCFWLAWS
jgi:hypothetical protein